MVNVIDKALGIRKSFANHIEAGYFLIGLGLGNQKTAQEKSDKELSKEDQLLNIYNMTKKSKKVFHNKDDFYSYLNS